MLQKIMSVLGGSLVKDISEAADRFITTDAEKLEFQRHTQEMVFKRFGELEQTAREEMKAKAQIIVAELQSGDSYTKKARPSVVYFGLVAIGCNYVIGPWSAHFIGAEIPRIELPTDFWMAWGGIVATWSIGRTAERRGATNKLTSIINGTSINSPTARHLLESE